LIFSFHGFQEYYVNIPLEFHVALLGFEGKDNPLATDPTKLANLLQQTLPFYQPSCWETRTPTPPHSSSLKSTLTTFTIHNA
jgi:hypothetical protein